MFEYINRQYLFLKNTAFTLDAGATHKLSKVKQTLSKYCSQLASYNIISYFEID